MPSYQNLDMLLEETGFVCAQCGRQPKWSSLIQSALPLGVIQLFLKKTALVGWSCPECNDTQINFTVMDRECGDKISERLNESVECHYTQSYSSSTIIDDSSNRLAFGPVEKLELYAHPPGLFSPCCYHYSKTANGSSALKLLFYHADNRLSTDTIEAAVLSGSHLSSIQQHLRASMARFRDAFHLLGAGNGKLNAAELQAAERECPALAAIVSNCRIIQEHKLLIRRIAALRTKVPLLIQGESGTGKELFARAYHECRGVSGEFVPVNCATLPKSLAPSELFGFAKYSHSLAAHDHAGLFETAAGGTLFLDEISTLPNELQVLLLRVLQERMFRRVGSPKEKPTDAQIIIATNSDLEAEVKGGGFRADLYYRIEGLRIFIPPLRERKEDIAPLIGHFIHTLGGTDWEGLVVSEECLEFLKSYDWPGNVRQLQNAITVALMQQKTSRDRSMMTTADLPSQLVSIIRAHNKCQSIEEENLRGRMKITDSILRQMVAKFGPNKNRIAAELNVHPATIYRRLKRLHL